MTYLDGVLTAGAGSSLDQGVPGVDDATDPVGVGVQLGLKGLMFLMFTLRQNKRHEDNKQRNKQY